jgi:hypothetical protein
MGMKMVCTRVASWSLFALAALLLVDCRSADELPVPIANSLAELKLSFRGTTGFMDARPMRAEIERNADLVDAILAYSRSSTDSADRLAAHLLHSLSVYAERFRPGTAIDEETLKPQRRVVGTEPEHGLNMDAYFVLEVAKQKQSGTFTRRALSTLYDVMRAHSHLAEQRILYGHPELHDQVVQSRREFGWPLSSLGGEIAWCCEQFMVSAYLADEPPLPESGLAVVTDYWHWRKDTMIRSKSADCLPWHYQQETMQHVKALVDALGENSDPGHEEG